MGAFSVKKNAEAMLEKLKKAGHDDAFITYSGTSGGTSAQKITAGSKVRVKAGAKTYSGGNLASFVYSRDHIVKELSGKRAVITYGGTVVAAVNVDDLRTRWRLSNVTPDTGKERTPCVASNSRRRASASACARASSSCFKRASAAALRAFFSLKYPTSARTTATATPEANSPIPSGRKVKEHIRNSVAATKRAIEDFFILIPLSNCKFLRQNSPILTVNTIIRPSCAKIKNKAEYLHTVCK